ETSVLWGTNGEPDAAPRASVGPEAGLSGLQLTFSYEGGAVNLLSAVEDTNADAGAAGSGGDVASTSLANVPCPPEVEIEVQLQIRSDGGALDETVTTKLRARSTDLASFNVEIDAAELTGELMLTGQSASDWPLSQVVIRGVIAE